MAKVRAHAPRVFRAPIARATHPRIGGTDDGAIVAASCPPERGAATRRWHRVAKVITALSKAGP